jgi:hypothetical protein
MWKPLGLRMMPVVSPVFKFRIASTKRLGRRSMLRQPS